MNPECLLGRDRERMESRAVGRQQEKMREGTKSADVGIGVQRKEHPSCQQRDPHVIRNTYISDDPE